MGKSFYDQFSSAKQIFEEVNDSLGQNLSKIIFSGTEEENINRKYSARINGNIYCRTQRTFAKKQKKR